MNPNEPPYLKCSTTLHSNQNVHDQWTDDYGCEVPTSELYDPSSTENDKDMRKCLPFLQKTYHIIENAPKHIAGWSELGDSFIVYQPCKFEEEILPKYFRHRKFTSFVRQLNSYGFRKTKESSWSTKRARRVNMNNNERAFWEFQHEYFIRGKPSLLKEIRKKTNGNGYNEASYIQSYEATNRIESMDLHKEVLLLRQDVKNMKHQLSTIFQFIQDHISQKPVDKTELSNKVEDIKNIKKNSSSSSTTIQDKKISKSNDKVSVEVELTESLNKLPNSMAHVECRENSLISSSIRPRRNVVNNEYWEQEDDFYGFHFQDATDISQILDISIPNDVSTFPYH